MAWDDEASDQMVQVGPALQLGLLHVVIEYTCIASGYISYSTEPNRIVWHSRVV